MKWLFLSLLLSISPLGAHTSLKEKIAKAASGDYIVAEQGKNLSILLIKSLSTQSVVFEEITTPQSSIDCKQFSWQEWLTKKAPGHTSWILYEIDFTTNTLKECYSYSKKEWLHIDEDDYFFSKLIRLNLLPVFPEKRKKIGPPPPAGEVDRRAFWIPSIAVDGKKTEKPRVDVLTGLWQKDNSKLSESEIECYFDANRPLFPFPLWTEIKGEHYTLKVRAIDSGSGLISPAPSMPYRAPYFLGSSQKQPTGIRLTLKSPTYHKKFRLYATDLTAELRETIPIPYTMTETNQQELIALDIETSTLQAHLISGHKYRWSAIPEETPFLYAESDEIFIYEHCPQ